MSKGFTVLPGADPRIKVNVRLYASRPLMLRAIVRATPRYSGKLSSAAALIVSSKLKRNALDLDLYLPSYDPPLGLLAHEFVHVPDIILDQLPPPPKPRIDVTEFRAYWVQGLLDTYVLWRRHSLDVALVPADELASAIQWIDWAYQPRQKTKFKY